MRWSQLLTLIVAVANALGCSGGSEQVGGSAAEYLAYEKSLGSGVDVTGVRLREDLEELESDRSVSAILEIDRAHDVPELALAVRTRSGVADLRSILAEVGIAVDIVWSDRLAEGELVDVPWPGETQLRDLMTRYRDVPVREGQWHFYLLLGRKTEAERGLSLVIDPKRRTGAVAFVDPEDEAGTLHAVGHEIGHLLNLPHPWEVYGNTRSLMSYPWRWEDWDWEDPEVFRFDAVGRRHILRAPEVVVRPGGGPLG